MSDYYPPDKRSLHLEKIGSVLIGTATDGNQNDTLHPVQVDRSGNLLVNFPPGSSIDINQPVRVINDPGDCLCVEQSIPLVPLSINTLANWRTTIFNNNWFFSGVINLLPQNSQIINLNVTNLGVGGGQIDGIAFFTSRFPNLNQAEYYLDTSIINPGFEKNYPNQFFNFNSGMELQERSVLFALHCPSGQITDIEVTLQGVPRT